MSSKTVFQIASFFLYILLQGLILQNAVLFDRAFSFAYVAFLLCLPVDLSLLGLLIIGFVTGLGVDIFYDSLGMHTASCVFIMFIRNYWLNMITPQGGYDVGSIPSIDLNGWQWFAAYILPMLFIHHAVLLFIEASSFSLVGYTLVKVIMSTIFSAIVIFILQYLFYRNKRY